MSSGMKENSTIIDISLSGAVGVATTCFLLYWFIAHSTSYKSFLSKWIRTRHVDTYLPLYQKGLGILLIGVVPGIIITVFREYFPGDYGLVAEKNWATVLWIFGFGGILFFIPYFSSRNKKMQSFYPQIRVNEWDTKLLIINALVWGMYLFAYEFLFRSFLLCSLLITLDTTSSIVIATAISVATHMPKGSAETFGTIPFSIMLCLAMIFTGSIWAGFIIHLTLALANDHWALYFNPEMGLRKKVVSIN